METLYEVEEAIGLVGEAEYGEARAAVLLVETEIADAEDRRHRWQSCAPDSAEALLSKVTARRLARRQGELERQMAGVAAMYARDASLPRDGDFAQVRHFRELLRREKQKGMRQLAGIEYATGRVRSERAARLEETLAEVVRLTVKIRKLESEAANSRPRTWPRSRWPTRRRKPRTRRLSSARGRSSSARSRSSVRPSTVSASSLAGARR